MRPGILVILLTICTIAFRTAVFAEGTTQLVPIAKRPNATGALYLSHNNNTAVPNSYSKFGQLNADTSYRLMFTVNALNEKVFFGFNSDDVDAANQSGYKYYIRQPNNVLLGPYAFPISGNGYIQSYAKADLGPNTINPTGYVPITLDPSVTGLTGNYSIEFTFPDPAINNNSFTIQYFDITVAAPSGATYVPIPGRVWSRSWQVNSDFMNKSFFGNFYIYSEDGIVTKFAADSMKTGTFSIFSNENGCSTSGLWEVRRKSVSYRVDALPQYKIFLNTPDEVIYPVGELGTIISATQQLPANCDGSVTFIVVVDKPGKVTLSIDCLPLGSDSGEDVSITSEVIENFNNLISWNGNDNTGAPMGSGTNIIVNIDYLNSLTNLPLYDVEGNDKGFKVDIVKPMPNPLPPTGTKLKIYWDDTNLSAWGGYNNATIGCLYPANPPAVTGCHNWTFASSNSGGSENLGNKHTVNSWWYYLSEGTIPMTVIIKRLPATPLIPQGPTPVCQGETVTYTVPFVPSATSYVWTLPDGSTYTTNTNQLIYSFPVATSGNLSVHGVNAQCGDGPESPALYIEVFASSTPTLTGNASICIGSSGNVYTTEAGKTNYIWTVSSGGTITSGGGNTNNTVTVTWNTAGANSVSVSYAGPPPQNCASGIATLLPVVVHPLPVPVISGPATPCVNSSGNVYSTATGMTGYTWNVSVGGTITSGNGTSSIIVTWNTTGPKTVSVNYTDNNNCSALAPTVFNVTVNTVSTPTLSGPSAVCVNSTNNVYTTESGNTNYIWTVSAGGTITSGGTSTSNTVTVTWNTAGPKTVSVNYTNSGSCAAGAPTVYTVSVSALPNPTITGPVSVCINASGNVYSTQAGNTNYTWIVSAGGTVTSGGTSTSNSVTVTWNTTGPKTVSVNYTNAGSCTAASPTVYNVNVNPVPVPTISGPTQVCENSTNNVYTTQGGNSNYIWTVSPGGTVTSGGTINSSSVTVTWNTPGNRSVSVNYSNSSNCTAANATLYTVTVYSQASPTLSGPSSVCASATNNVYTTESGNTNYVWSISSGGTITAGGTSSSNTVTVTWNSSGNQSVSVNYSNSAACSASSSTVYNVVVNALPMPVINGPVTLCANTGNNVYSTQSGNSNYTWLVSSGGTITGGGTSTSNTVTITWNTAGSQTVSVNYTNASQCTAVAPVVKNITVNPLPVPVITGPDYICNNTPNNIYQTQPGNSNYSWNISTGGSITSGGTSVDNLTAITWTQPGLHTVSVNYSNNFNCSAAAPYIFNIEVSPQPLVSAGSGSTICASKSVNLSGSQNNCSSVQWTTTGDGTFSNDAIVNPVYSPGTADIANGSVVLTLIGYGSEACSGQTNVKSITLNIDPMPTVNAGLDGTFCVQNALNVDGASATHFTELIWTGGDGIFNDNLIPAPTYMPGSNDFINGNVTLTIKVRGDLSCSNEYVTDSRVFSVTRYPTIYAGPDDFICSSETEFQLVGSGSDYSLNNILWTFIGGDGSFNDPAIIQPLYYPGTIDLNTIDRSIVFNLNIHGINNCSTISLNDQVELKIDPRPISNAGSDNSICGQRPYQLNATAQYHSDINWITNGDGYFNNPGLLNPTYTPGPGDVNNTVRLTLDLSGCNNLNGSDFMLLTVHPDPSVTISGSTTECEGTPVPVSIVFTGAPPWNVTYTNGINPVTVSGIMSSPYTFYVSPDVSSTYWVSNAEDLFCNAPADSIHGVVFVAINPLPDLFLVTASNDGFYCEGDTGISIGLNNSQIGMTYELFHNGSTTGIILNGTGNPLQFGIFSGLGQYAVRGLNPVGNCAAMMIDTIQVIMNPTPVTDFATNKACLGDTTIFSLSGDFINKISNWFWSFGDGTYETYHTPYIPVHVYPTHGTYQVILSVVDTNGCKYTVTHPVEILPHPTAFFSISTPNCLDGFTQFTDLSSNPAGQGYINQWIWTFGDGSPADTLDFPESPNINHTYAAQGNYNVTLTITNSKGCIADYAMVVTVSNRPVADFTFWSGCEDQAASFVDNSSENLGGQIVNRSWDFGDAASGALNFSNLEDPVHTYSDAGTYSVSLITTNLNGCSDTALKVITVKGAPPASFFSSPGCLNSPTLFLADSLIINIGATATYHWDFGDGGSSANRNTTHNYLSPGTYNVVLTITDTAGCAGDTLIPVTVNPPPTAHFSASADNCQGQAVAFTNQSTTLTGFITKWEWNFGDGNTQTILFPSSPSTTHTYAGTGTFNVTLTVTNSEGCQHSESRLINSLGAPTSDFMAAGQCKDSPVSFTDLSSVTGTQSISAWHWDFGDPTSGVLNASTLQNPVHTYAGTGVFVVELITFTGNNCSDTLTKTITIKPVPVVDFNTQSACAGNPALFIPVGMNTAAIATWNWNFGDGGTSASQSPAYTYGASGTYSVVLTVSDTAGCSSTRTKTIVIAPLPSANFGYTTPSCQGDAVSFTDMSSTASGFLARWDWDFGDGNTQSVTFPAVPDVTHLYANDGTFNVTLTVKTNDSCTHFLTRVVTVLPKPSAAFLHGAACQGSSVAFTDQSISNTTGGISEWAWNFGDPTSGTANTSGLQHPAHSYNLAGTYTVTLIVSIPGGCSDTTTLSVAVSPPPVVGFTQVAGCNGDTTQFTSSASVNMAATQGWYWQFGDGATSFLTDPMHIYATAGTFMVTLTITDTAGCTNSKTLPVTVIPGPLAAFSSSTPGCSGLPITFTDLSNANGGSLAAWFWDFGDGTDTTYNAAVASFEHTYTQPGTFLVTLKVVSALGCENTKLQTIVMSPSPIAAFTFANTCQGQGTQFTDASNLNGGSSLALRDWDFGDPASGTQNSSALANPTHTFTQPGTYTVTLFTLNGGGCSDTVQQNVTITQKPTVDFYNDSLVCLGSTTTLFADTVATPIGAIQYYEWDFGDGSPHAFTQNVTHTYPVAGTFIVSLTVQDTAGCSNVKTHPLTIHPQPAALFSYAGICQNAPTLFTDLSIPPAGDTIVGWYWEFSRAGTVLGTDTLQNPEFTFSIPATYSVQLTAFTENGCSHTKILPVQIWNTPTAYFKYTASPCANGLVQFQDSSFSYQGTVNSWQWEFEPFQYGTGKNPSHLYYAVDSCYDVKLVIEDLRGCVDTLVQEVCVPPELTVDFTTSLTCFGSPVLFTSELLTPQAPADSLISFSWNFGDPATGTNNVSAIRHPAHTFSSVGFYTVNFTTTDKYGCSATAYQTVQVNALPMAGFSYTSGQCDSTLLFSSTSIDTSSILNTFIWNYGDGSAPDTTLVPNSTHKYNTAGIYTTTLTVVNANGCTDTYSDTVHRSACLEAAYLSEGDTLCQNYSLSFTDRSTCDGVITQWDWDFGDGTPPTVYTSYQPVVNHTFADAGIYTIRLKVSTLVGTSTLSDSTKTDVAIRPTPLTGFTVDPVCLGYKAEFADTTHANGSLALFYHWEFGDVSRADTSVLRNPDYLYTMPGQYTSQLVVKNQFGCADTATAVVMVNGLPEASYANSLACAGQQTFFFDASQAFAAPVITWGWRVKDSLGMIGSMQGATPAFIFDSTGQYYVRLMVADTNGCTDTIVQQVKVNAAPVSAFSYTENVENIQGQIQFTNGSMGALEYFWDFGNGVTSYAESPLITYAQDGTYPVMLVAVSEFGCHDTTLISYDMMFKGLYVPNAFAPGGPIQATRYWKPVGVNLATYDARVYNSHGMLIWSSTALDDNGAPAESWDGMFKGSLCQQDVYVWMISAVFRDGSIWYNTDIGEHKGLSVEKWGTISLIR